MAIFVVQVVGIFSHQFDWPGPFVDWQTYSNAAGRLLAGEGIYAPEQLRGSYHLTDMLLVGTPIRRVGSAADPVPGISAWSRRLDHREPRVVAHRFLVDRIQDMARVPRLAFAIILAGLSVFPPFKEGMLAMTTNIGLAGAIGWVSVGLAPLQAGVFGGLLAVVKVFSGAIGRPRSAPRCKHSEPALRWRPR